MIFQEKVFVERIITRKYSDHKIDCVYVNTSMTQAKPVTLLYEVTKADGE